MFGNLLPSTRIVLVQRRDDLEPLPDGFRKKIKLQKLGFLFARIYREYQNQKLLELENGCIRKFGKI